MARAKLQNRSSKWIVNVTLAAICFVWLIPTVGLLVSSFRLPADIMQSGWWSVLPHKEWKTTETIQLSKDLDLREPIPFQGKTYSSDELTSGVTIDGERYAWENRRQRLLAVQEQSWNVNWDFTIDNYKNVLGGKKYEIKTATGTKTQQGDDLSRAFMNTIAVAVPATVIPILIATFAAYGFAWMRFPGRKLFFVIVVALLVVPLQVALIPLMRDYLVLGINGSYLSVWLAHTGFGLPLATYFMYNYISQLPKDLFESAFMDGATHFSIFNKLILPLAVPALASIGIFQFLWVWNDYLVSLVFIGSTPNQQVLSMRIADMVGTRGDDWHLLTAAAFISMIIPLIVFFSLQRYFVKGLLGGSVKG